MAFGKLGARGGFGSLGALGGPRISLNLSASTVADTATVGTVIGTLSVTGGTGSYTYTFTSNPGTLFSITTNQLKVAAALTAGSDPITIKADNGAGSTVTKAFLITVTSSAGVALKADLSNANTNEAWVFW
jgi:hypothetical protein